MIHIPEITKNLGNIPYNVPKAISWELKNNTDEPIFIDSFGAGCGCTTPSLSINPIPAHSSGFFNATYSANSQGTNHKSAWIKVKEEQVNLYFTANVV